MRPPSAVSSLLLPLALLLQSSGSQAHSKFRMHPQEKRDMRPSQKVELQCDTVSSSNTGCSWLRLSAGAMVPTFLLYISGSTKAVKVAEGLDPKKFQGLRTSASSYILTLANFQEEDQGHYFCVVTNNAGMFFSPFVPVFLPVKATTPPPKPKTTTLETTTTSIQNSSGDGKCKPQSKEKKGWDFSCDLYIWAPLSGLCVVLLLALISTIITCQRSRKRVCQCPRPMVRPGGKTVPPNRYV